VEIHSYQHAIGLARAGHQVQVFTKRYANTPRRSEVDGVPVEALGTQVPLVGPFAFVVSAFLHLLRNRTQVDVLHVHFASYFVIPAYLMRLVAGKPYVISCHGYDVIYLQRRRGWRILQRAMFAKASFMTAASGEIKQILVDKYHLSQEKVVVVHNGVDEEEIQKAQREAVETDRRTVVFLGNLRPVKDPITALKAFEAVHAGQADIHLSIVGDGQLRKELERYVDASGLRKAVDMKGHLSHQDALKELSSAEVFLMSSLSEGGNPLALMEAMALGKPIVATAVGGVKDVIVDGENGLTVEPGSPSRLASALVKVLGDRELADRIATNAKAASLEYTWTRVISTYETIYAHLKPVPE